MIIWAMTAAFAGPCEDYALFEPSTSTTLTYFDRKGRVASNVITENREVRPDGSALLHARTTDKRGKEVVSVDYEMQCDDSGAVSVDMKAFLPPELFSAYAGQHDIAIESTALSFPDSMTAGQALPDAHLTANLTGSGGGPSPLGDIKIRVDLHDRRVVGQESVTVPAGTFDAWKITSKSTIVTHMVMKISVATSATDWYVPGLGIVRSETVRNNGKSAGHAELTALSRGG